MKQKYYSIGELAKITGVPVRRLRFYSDEGLLPPEYRSSARYRVFSEKQVIRVDLICALRDAGVSIKSIKELFEKSVSIRSIVRLRLAELDAQVLKQRQVAATLRAILNSPDDVSIEDIRRINHMTSLSEEEFANTIEGFIRDVTDGDSLVEAWASKMRIMSKVELPDHATTKQIDAWIELKELVKNPRFVQHMRENARDEISTGIDGSLFGETQRVVLERANEAINDGHAASSEVGQSIAQDYLEGWAVAAGVEANDEYWDKMRRKYLIHRNNTYEYWRLFYAISGRSIVSKPNSTWGWIDDAAQHFLAARGETSVTGIT